MIKYRADNYTHNMGELAGFFDTLEEALANLDKYETVTNEPQDGTFGQVTAFEYNDDASIWEAWENGNILNDWYTKQ